MAMYGSSADDWRALTENYRSMTDDQLCELAEDIGDLTSTAQQVLRDEMKLRKLGDPQAPNWGRIEPPAENAASALGEVDGAPAIEYTWKTLLCQCDSRTEAWQIYEVLRRAGIESWIEGPRTYAETSGSDNAGIDVGSQRVMVPADQLEDARIIIERPIPIDVIEESHITVPVYELPVCPRCGAPDPILESVDPINLWSCESCEAEWEEETE